MTTTPNTRIEYWTCDESAERLSCVELEDAVVEWVGGWDGDAAGGDIGVFLRATVAPLTVYGYSRAEVTDQRLEAEAALMVERLAERLEEDDAWGDPNGRHAVFGEPGRAALEALVLSALKQVRHHIEPWHCEVTQTVVLEADELVTMVRRLEPEWFAQPSETPGE